MIMWNVKIVWLLDEYRLLPVEKREGLAKGKDKGTSWMSLEMIRRQQGGNVDSVIAINATLGMTYDRH